MRALAHWWAGEIAVCSGCRRKVLLEDGDTPTRYAEDYPDALNQPGRVGVVETALFPCICGGEVEVQRAEVSFDATFPRMEA